MRFWRRLRRGDGLVALAFASPWIIGFCWFQLYPILASLYYSFTSYNILRPPVFVGLANYQNLFGHDELFLKALTNTAIFTLVSVPLGLTVALVLALLLNQQIPARPVFRAIMYFPAIIPSVATGILFALIPTRMVACSMLSSRTSGCLPCRGSPVRPGRCRR
jgi:multiple sugar transport system permease protein